MPSRLSNEQKEQVDNWIHDVGCDLAACYSQDKKKFKEHWGQNVIDNVDYDSRLELGWYDDGVAIICGQLRRGKYAGYYITCLDFDSKEAFDKFCEIFDKTLEQIAKWTRVEWHGDLEKIHIFLISKKPFTNKTAGGIEVKAGNPGRLLAFVSPSIHRSGKPYSAYDSESIAVIDNIEHMRIEAVIEMFIKARTNDTSSYFSNEDEKRAYLEYLELDTTILRAGERNPNTLLKACSYFFKRKDEFKDLSDEQRYDKLVVWHNTHCDPPLFQVRGRENEVPDIWDRVRRKFTGERQERWDKQDEQEKQIRDETKKSIPGICQRKQNLIAGFNETIRLGLASNIWTMISTNPPKFIVALQRQGHICRMSVSYSKPDSSKNNPLIIKTANLNFGTIIFRLFPHQVIEFVSPLKFLDSPPQYSITFENQEGKKFSVKGSIELILAQLNEKGYVASAYGAKEALNNIIEAFRDDGRIIIDESVDFEGYYYHDGEIKISNIEFDKKHPVRSREEVLTCIDYLEKRIAFQIWDYNGKEIDRRDVFASALQWTIAAPFNFVLKQLSPSGIKRYHKGFDMTGERDGGKSGLSQEMLSIHGNGSGQEADSIYSIPIGSANTDAKLGKIMSRTTYPIEISEINRIESYGRNEPLVETLKNAIESIKVREGRKGGRYDAPFPSCSALILNGNPFITKKGELLKRLHVVKYSEEDRHDRSPNTPFNKFQVKDAYLIKILGDWTMRYIWEHREEELLSKKYDGYQIGKFALHEFYKSVDKEIPEWLTLWITDTSLEELDTDEESVIRSILYDIVHTTIERNGRVLNAADVDKMGQITFEQRIGLCLDNALWSWVRKLTYEEDYYYINTTILEIFSRRLPDLSFKKFAEKTGITPSLDHNGRTVLKCSKKQIVDFISGNEKDNSKVGTKESVGGEFCEGKFG